MGEHIQVQYKQSDEAKLEEWVREAKENLCKGGLASSERDLEVRRKYVAEAIRHARNSAPEVDGISATHWKRLGGLAIDTLTNVAKAMQTEGWEEEAIRAAEAWGNPKDALEYNRGLMVCIPKRPGEVDDVLGEINSPGTTRPLMLVGVDNRMVASAFREKKMGEEYPVVHDLEHRGPGSGRGDRLLRT